jgi:hypothetical protein
MIARTARTRTRAIGVVAAAAVALGVCVILAERALARISVNTIDPVAILTDGGRHVILSGPVQCTGGEAYHTRVTITQRESGAVAEGWAVIECSGGEQEWMVHAWVRGDQAFDRGSARAVAFARTFDGGFSTDSHQWMVDVVLEEE